MSVCVLIVESDSSSRAELISLFGPSPYEAVGVATQAEAINLMAERSVQLMVTELPRMLSDSADSEVQAGFDNAAMHGWMDLIRKHFPLLPIVLLTRPGTEPIAWEALLKGAASYVPRAVASKGLIETVRQVLAVNVGSMVATELEECITRMKLELVLPSDESLVPGVIAKLEQATDQLGLFDEMVWTQVAMALDEAILNAMIHGNLEVQSHLREVDDGAPYWDEIKRRRELSPYQTRRASIVLTATRNQAIFIVRDQGPGFDTSKIPDLDDPINLESMGGRGLMLINAFMDEIHYNEAGNELTMIKRKASGPC